MKGPDDVTPALGTSGSGGCFPADARPETHPAGAQCRSPFVDLDDSLILEVEDAPDDAFEDWSCWPCPDEHLWAAYGHPTGDLRNPPKIISDELSRPESC